MGQEERSSDFSIQIHRDPLHTRQAQIKSSPANFFLLPLAKVVKFLGLNLSTHFVSSTQVKSANGKSSGRIQLLKATSGQDWGNKKTLHLPYNTFLKLVMIFGTPLWYPNLDPESKSIKRRQRGHESDDRLPQSLFNGPLTC
jgi:hypothetical protein